MAGIEEQWKLSWTPPDWPDLAGVVIRYHPTANQPWSGMLPLHRGILTASPFPFYLPNDTYDFVARTISTLGVLGEEVRIRLYIINSDSLRSKVIPPIKKTADEAAAEAVAVARRTTILEAKPREWTLLRGTQINVGTRHVDYTLPDMTPYRYLAFIVDYDRSYGTCTIPLSALTINTGRRASYRGGASTGSAIQLELKRKSDTLLEIAASSSRTGRIHEIWGVRT